MEKSTSDEKYAEVKSTSIRSAAIFFTAVATAAILVSGMIVAAHLLANGIGGDQTTASTAAQASKKMMDSDMSMEVGLMMNNGEMKMERISYDYDSNVILIDTPENFYRNNSAATFAFDMDRSVIFATLHEDDECIAFQLSKKMANELNGYLEEREDNVVEVSTLPFDLTNYEEVAVVPDDYIKVTNGAIIRGLCAGKPTTWLQPSTSGTDSATRRKRGCGLHLVCCCSWTGCHCGLVFKCSWGK